MNDFYDRMAGLYHLIFQNWDESIERQTGQLTRIIQERWGGAKEILDVSCGIGTQSVGLAGQGFLVTGSDLSAESICRAKREAQQRGLGIEFSVCDMRCARSWHARQFDAVICCDNSITHLLDDDDLRLALGQIYECSRPGGGCLLTVRDYDKEQHGTGLVKSYGTREVEGKRYVIFQVWDFTGSIYDLTMYFVEDDRTSNQVVTHVMRTKYNAVGTNHLMHLMRQVGFTNVVRLDDQFYQPVLLGDRDA